MLVGDVYKAFMYYRTCIKHLSMPSSRYDKKELIENRKLLNL